MTEERCERTDLIVTQCAHCLGHADPVADALADERPRRYAVDTENLPTTAALYRSRCPRCDDPIEIDDLITLVGSSWVCTECAP